jgi:hypothetical protein
MPANSSSVKGVKGRWGRQGNRHTCCYMCVPEGMHTPSNGLAAADMDRDTL